MLTYFRVAIREPVPVLSYAAPSAASSISRTTRIVFVIAFLPAVAGIFVPFTYGIGPGNVLLGLFKYTSLDELRIDMIALPFFLAIPIWLIQVRLLLAGRITRPERAIAISFAICAALLTLAFIGSALLDQAPSFSSWSGEEWITFSIAPVILPVGSLATVWLARGCVKSEIVLKGCLYTAYLANAILCLVGFRTSRDPGWYIAVFTCLVMMIEIVWIRRRL